MITQSIQSMERPRILVVDDEKENVEFLETLLVSRGYHIRTATESRLAIQQAIEFLPDLILMDVMMPGKPGYEVCEEMKMKEDLKEVPVIFISALNRLQDKMKAFSSGGVDYIIKPFQPQEILARVQTHLSLRSMQKQLRSKNIRLEEEIAHRKGIEEDLKKAKEAAEAANEAKTRFLTFISHEIRTPMNAVVCLVELLLESPLNPLQKKYIQMILSNTEYLLSILNDLLDFSRIEADKFRFQVINFDFYELLKDVNEMMAFQCQAKSIQYLCVKSKTVPQYLQGDPLRLRQILLNLLSNAMKFTKEGKISLQIESEKQEPRTKREMLHFTIVDTGLGISPEELAQLFLPFSQARSAAGRGGSGLGLAICKKLIEMMGGTIDVKSEIGKGSQFQFHLPFDESTKTLEKIQRIESLQGQDAPARENFKGIRLLLVEDDTISRELMTEVLTRSGMIVSTVENGQEAVDAVRQNRYDVVLMDLEMPKMTGLEATHYIRDQLKLQNLPIIALTSHASQGNRDTCLQAGMNDYLNKPITKKHLFPVLYKWCFPGGKPRPSARLSMPEEDLPSSAPSSGSIPGIHEEEALLRMDGDQGLFRHLLKEFIRRSPQELEEIKVALTLGNLEEAKRSLHHFKGAAAELSAYEISTLTMQLESALKEGKKDSFLILLQGIHSSLAQITKAIEEGIE